MTIFSCTSEIVRTRATRGPNRFHERGNRPLRRHLILCTSSLSTDRPTVEGEREGSGLWIVVRRGLSLSWRARLRVSLLRPGFGMSRPTTL